MNENECLKVRVVYSCLRDVAQLENIHAGNYYSAGISEETEIECN